MRLRDRIAAFLRETFGPVTFDVAVRRGFFGGPSRCPHCCREPHDVGEVCPRMLRGDCSACGATVLLDAYGNCPSNRPTHFISNRRPAFASSRTPYSSVAPALRPEIGA